MLVWDSVTNLFDSSIALISFEILICSNYLREALYECECANVSKIIINNCYCYYSCCSHYLFWWFVVVVVIVDILFNFILLCLVVIWVFFRQNWSQTYIYFNFNNIHLGEFSHESMRFVRRDKYFMYNFFFIVNLVNVSIVFFFGCLYACYRDLCMKNHRPCYGWCNITKDNNATHTIWVSKWDPHKWK